MPWPLPVLLQIPLLLLRQARILQLPPPLTVRILLPPPLTVRILLPPPFLPPPFLPSPRRMPLPPGPMAPASPPTHARRTLPGRSF